jgi:hypothetical protein
MTMTAIDVPDGFDPIDMVALQLAIAKARAGNKRQREQIDSMLKDRSWDDVAQFAAYGCQMDSMHLKPWQTPPCHVADENEPRVGEEEVAKLLRRMLKAGISRSTPTRLWRWRRSRANFRSPRPCTLRSTRWPSRPRSLRC